MRATNRLGASERKYPEIDSLFFKFQGPTQASLQETAKIVKEITKKHGAISFELARSEKDANDLWADRKNAYNASLTLVEGARGLGTDVWFVLFSLRAGDFIDAVYHSAVSLSQGFLISSTRRSRTLRDLGLSVPLLDTPVMASLHFFLQLLRQS